MLPPGSPQGESAAFACADTVAALQPARRRAGADDLQRTVRTGVEAQLQRVAEHEQRLQGRVAKPCLQTADRRPAERAVGKLRHLALAEVEFKPTGDERVEDLWSELL